MNVMVARKPANIRRGTGRDREIITPEGIVLPITIASRGSRAGALILDLVIIGLVQVVTTIALIFLAFGSLASLVDGAGAAAMGSDGAGTAAMGSIEFLTVIWLIAMFLFRNAYFLFFELGPRGATPGKRIAGIRVASRDGGRLTVEMVVARNLLRDIELFLPLMFIGSATGEGDGGAAGLAALAWFLIFTLFPFWNRDRLRAGDIVAGTWVVERPTLQLEAVMTTSATPQEGGQPHAVAYRFSDQELGAYGEYELQTLERILRESRPDSLQAVHEAIARKIGSSAGVGDERAFLDAYYAQLRARLEARMRMGKRKPDKFA